MSSTTLSPAFEAFRKEVEDQACRLALKMDRDTFIGLGMQIWLQSIGQPIKALNLPRKTQAQVEPADFVAVGATVYWYLTGSTKFYVLLQGENGHREGFYFNMFGSVQPPFAAYGPFPLDLGTDDHGMKLVVEQAAATLEHVLSRIGLAGKEVADGVH